MTGMAMNNMEYYQKVWMKSFSRPLYIHIYKKMYFILTFPKKYRQSENIYKSQTKHSKTSLSHSSRLWKSFLINNAITKCLTVFTLLSLKHSIKLSLNQTQLTLVYSFDSNFSPMYLLVIMRPWRRMNFI